jgi:hypothetical protein
VRHLRPFLAALAALTVAGTATAQSFTLTSAGTVVSGGVYVGPYQGNFPGGPSIDVTCIDYFNDAYLAPNPLATWNVTQTTLGNGANLANTRFGSMWGAEALSRYRIAGYLSTQFSSVPTAQWGDLHRTIWNVMAPTAPPTGFGGYNLNTFLTSSYGTNAYITAMVNSFGGPANFWTNFNAYNWDSFTVLSDTRMTTAAPGSCPAWAANGANCAQIGGRQEFITTTPEPATLLMLGSGLLILLGAAVSRGTLV